MAVDHDTPEEYQDLGKVLQKILSGDLKPDLSRLPPELVEIVRKALE
jgi:hypothetical protein